MEFETDGYDNIMIKLIFILKCLLANGMIWFFTLSDLQHYGEVAEALTPFANLVSKVFAIGISMYTGYVLFKKNNGNGKESK